LFATLPLGCKNKPERHAWCYTASAIEGLRAELQKKQSPSRERQSRRSWVPRAKRVELIAELERSRDSRVIAYVTGDRQGGLETRIGMDVFPLFYNVLTKIGKREQIDLFLYSTGGATMASWGLVNLLREFCKELCVLVPFKAHSTATLICLGADAIIMSSTGQLSPVDPTVTSPFNPKFEVAGQPPHMLPVSVEDVQAFLDLARDEAKILEPALITEVFKQLSGDVRPLALSSVYRAKQQIKMVARKLLEFQLKGGEQDRIEAIVSKLTRELYSHDYIISRREADGIGLRICACPDHVEKAMMNLFFEYSNDAKLATPYSQEAVVGTQTEKTVDLDRAFIESTQQSYVFRTRRQVRRFKSTQGGPPGGGFSGEEHRGRVDAGGRSMTPWNPDENLTGGATNRPAARSIVPCTSGLGSASQLVSGTGLRVAIVGSSTAVTPRGPRLLLRATPSVRLITKPPGKVIAEHQWQRLAARERRRARKAGVQESDADQAIASLRYRR
jgi:ClpP class serine protease